MQVVSSRHVVDGFAMLHSVQVKIFKRCILRGRNKNLYFVLIYKLDGWKLLDIDCMIYAYFPLLVDFLFVVQLICWKQEI